MIVDKKSDLNIYKERVQEGEEGDSCSAPKETASSFCGTAEGMSKDKEKEESAKRVDEIDFNEWVSKLSSISVLSNFTHVE
jgi:hypothetical protein